MSYTVGPLAGGSDPTRYTMSEYYTATSTGFHELEVFNYRDAAMQGGVYNFIDNITVGPPGADFEVTTNNISAAQAGSVDMILKAGPSWSNEPYLVLAAESVYPGFVLDGIQVHLNPDAIFLFSLQNVNGPNFENSQGVLDSAGEAVFTFNTLGPAPAMLGRHFPFEYFILTSSSQPRPIRYASHPVLINFIP